ncbi:MAG: hypothetical protein QNJ91_13210 [Gammaproteobacteria bacterium]|nr:hypothetical protein [Gammaproteobacteria bacterium]
MPDPWLATLFPAQPRGFRGERWLNIGLRCAHLVGIAGMAGGFLFALDAADWGLYWYLALASGVALSVMYVWSTAAWLFELKGLAVLLKIALLAGATAYPALRGEVFVTIIVLSGLIAHAPAKVRSRQWLRPPGTIGRRPPAGGR